VKPTFTASLAAAAVKVGNGALVAYWCFAVPVTIFLLAVTPILVARQDAALRRQLLETRPTPFPPPPMDLAGQPVLLAGEIGVLGPEPPEGSGFALFERETERTNGSWLLDLIVKPPFELVLENGSVRIENECRWQDKGLVGHLSFLRHTLGLAEGCYRLGGTAPRYLEDGVRFYGMRPGDRVSVVGTMRGGTVSASAVFAGPASEYADSLRSSQLWTGLSVGMGVALLATTIWIVRELLGCQREMSPPGEDCL
jgi:hypothetical protein